MENYEAVNELEEGMLFLPVENKLEALMGRRGHTGQCGKKCHSLDIHHNHLETGEISFDLLNTG